LKTGELHTAEEVKSKFDEQLGTVEMCAEEAGLGLSCEISIKMARLVVYKLEE